MASLRNEMQNTFAELKAQLQLQSSRPFLAVIGHPAEHDSLSENIDRTVIKMQGLARYGDDLARAVSSLKALYFPGMESRYDRIVTAHHQTCQWAFESDFMPWVKSTNFLFWVCRDPAI
jgi:hypothetical protein